MGKGTYLYLYKQIFDVIFCVWTYFSAITELLNDSCS